MHLENYARKHGMDTSDYGNVNEASKRGWKYLALYTDQDGSEPCMILIQSPTWPNYQVRDISSGIQSGTMLTEKQVKQWIFDKRKGHSSS